jgi:hypothetical protein
MGALLPAESLGKLFDVAFVSGFERSVLGAKEEEVFAANPGMREAVLSPVRAEARTAFDRAAPALRRAIGLAMAPYMSPDDMRTTAGFLSTTVGRRMLQAIFAMFADGAATKAETDAARDRFMASLTADERAEIESFARTAAMGRFGRAIAATRLMGKDWAAQFVNDEGLRLRQLYADLRRNFLERKKSAI